MSTRKLSLLKLPDDVLERILHFISYDEVSQCRRVCRKMDHICKRMLNRGFHKVEKYHAQCLRRVKAQLPRRESERRAHPFARHCDVLTAVETRISLLGMTFMKFIDLKMCCFIPGKVLDEIFKVLRYVSNEENPIRANEVLTELRDLSSMAMEHFDEKISPAFKNCKKERNKMVGVNMLAGAANYEIPRVRVYENSTLCQIKEPSAIGCHGYCPREVQTLRQRIFHLERVNKNLEKKVLQLKNLVSTQTEKMKEHDLKFEVFNRIITSGKILSAVSKDPSTSTTMPPSNGSFMKSLSKSKAKPKNIMKNVSTLTEEPWPSSSPDTSARGVKRPLRVSERMKKKPRNDCFVFN